MSASQAQKVKFKNGLREIERKIAYIRSLEDKAKNLDWARVEATYTTDGENQAVRYVHGRFDRKLPLQESVDMTRLVALGPELGLAHLMGIKIET